MSIRSIAVLVLLLMNLGASTAVLSIEHHVRPRLSFKTLVNDNRRLQSVDPTTVYGGVTNIGAEMILGDELYSATIQPNVRVSRFEGDSDLNREEYFVDGAARRLYSSGVMELAGAYSDTSTLTSELDDFGLFFANKSRISYLLAPRATYFFSPVWTVNLSGSINDVTFEDSETTGFVNYTYYSLGADSIWKISERTALTANVSSSIFDTPDSNSRSETVTYRAGFQHAYSDSTNIVASIGNVLSTIEIQSQQLFFEPGLGFVFRNVQVEERERGMIIDIDVRKQLQRGQIRGSYSRSLTPSSQGVQSRNESVFGETRWRISQHLESVLGISYQERASEGDRVRSLERTTLVASGALNYRITEFLSISAGYQYRRQKQSSTGNVVDYNELSLTFNFTGERAPFPEPEQH